MYSHQSFIPGSNFNLKKIRLYDSFIKKLECNCFKETNKQLKTAENDPNFQSNTLRIGNIIQNTPGNGGRIEFGNSYLNNFDQPLIDSLGSIEGQPGGSYKPLRNRF
jgi:hypothetical protein